jgi:hypothetical protein
MTTSTLYNAFTINGVVDTGKPVLQNMQELANAASAWVTFDQTSGRWSVVINKEGSSVKAFNNSNILGSINVSSTGLTELYNSVEVEFPHKDLRDQKDYVRLNVLPENRFPNEPDNTLTIKFDNVNDPVQALALGGRQLKQSRVDKVIQFRTDYSSLGLKAGDIITVTADMYGFNAKLFRVTTLTEEDGQDGSLILSITAIEYDSDVYDLTGLYRSERNSSTAITAQSINGGIQASNQLGSSLGTNSSLKYFTTGTLNATGPNTATTGKDFDLGQQYTIPVNGIYKVTYYCNWGSIPNSVHPPGGVYKGSYVFLLKADNATPYTFQNWQATGDYGSPLYEDHILSGTVTFNAGDVINFWFTAVTDYAVGKTYYGVDHNNGNIINITVPSGAYPAIVVTVDLQLVQRLY